MELSQTLYSVLVISSSEKFNSTIVKLLPDERYYPVKVVTDGGSASRLLLEIGFDIVIINTPLKDEFGTHLAYEICRKSDSGILLLVRHEHYSDINMRLTPMGILTLSKPAPANLILETLLILCGTRTRLQRMRGKSLSFEEKMAEIRLINQAKMILISTDGLNENEAHHAIERLAMDRCVSKTTIAREIIKKGSGRNEEGKL